MLVLHSWHSQVVCPTIASLIETPKIRGHWSIAFRSRGKFLRHSKRVNCKGNKRQIKSQLEALIKQQRVCALPLCPSKCFHAKSGSTASSFYFQVMPVLMHPNFPTEVHFVGHDPSLLHRTNDWTCSKTHSTNPSA